MRPHDTGSDNRTMQHEQKPSIGSLFAGIGGFDLGFERAGYTTAWQVEINPVCRAVLAHRFAHARQYEDVRNVGRHNLKPVDVITAGFPCQDISVAGSTSERKGLAGERSGLFWEVIRIVRELRPQWVVLENVASLLSINDGADFTTVITALADSGYVGCWRVLDARYFGVAQMRRRVFVVAGLGCQPPMELLADAAAVEAIPSTAAPQQKPRPADSWPANTLLTKTGASQITLGCETLVAHADGWRQMVERQREADDRGLCLGLDETGLAEAAAAGNAVVPQVAEWIARKLISA